MAVSRNAREFLERAGIVNLTVPPKPRLNISDLLIHQIPIEAPLPTQAVLRQYEGDPPVDRGSAKPWPNQVPLP